MKQEKCKDQESNHRHDSVGPDPAHTHGVLNPHVPDADTMLPSETYQEKWFDLIKNGLFLLLPNIFFFCVIITIHF